MTAVRHLSGFKGRLLAPVFPLGLAKRTVADHLRHFLAKVEEQGRAAPVAKRCRYVRPVSRPCGVFSQ